MTKPTRTALLIVIVGITASAAISYAIHRNVLQPAKVREDAFAAVLDGRLKPDEAGVIHLPPEWAPASIDGNVYVTRDTTGSTWALFLQERGTGAQFRGFAFCDRPATARVATNLELRYPVPEMKLPDGTTRPPLDHVVVRIKRVL